MPPLNEQQQLEAVIAGLEAQRALLGDAVTEAALGPMRERLAVLALAKQPHDAPTPAEVAAAAVSAPAAQARRLVSILFTDIVGSTRIAELLDAEDMLEFSSQALAELAAVVQAHQGRVLRYTGDGLKAVFGADAVREDDAERAVACGLAMLDAAQRFASVCKQRSTMGLEIAIRVGIHSGSVALGGGIEGGATVMGSSVNLAARLEQAAAVGSVLISQATQALVRGLFDLEARAPLALKGFDHPVRCHRVLRARPRTQRSANRGVEGLATRMFGRDHELASLQLAFERLLVPKASLSVVTLVAEPGVGKSRLLAEFEAWAAPRRERVRILRGRATPQMQGQPFGLLRDILVTRLRIADDDPVDLARAKFEQGVLPLLLHEQDPALAEANTQLLAHLIGIDWRDSPPVAALLDDPRQLRQRALDSATLILHRAGVGRRLLLIIEDLHWADQDSLDFLQQVVDGSADAPMLALLLCRASLFEDRPAWRTIAARHPRIDLAPLDAQHSAQMASALLGRLPAVPPVLQDLLTRSAEGNPFYMEELVNMLIAQGCIETGTDPSQAWRFHADRLQAQAVPTTLTGVLQARLDSLPAAERRTLQQASVVGPMFWDKALYALDGQARGALPALVRRELTLPREGQAGPSDPSDATDPAGRAEAEAGHDDLNEYLFRHQILHQVTYDTVLKRDRRDLHGRLAFWLAARTGLRAKDFLGVTAEHFEQAGDARRAAEFHAQAAEQAALYLAHDTVLRHVARALDLLEPGAGADQAELRWRLLTVRERSLDVQGDRDAQAVDIEAMEGLADRRGDAVWQAHAAYRRSVMSQRLGDWPACEAAGRRGMTLAAPSSQAASAAPGATHGPRLLCGRLVALALAKRGELAAGHALALACLQEARLHRLRSVESFCVNALAVIAGMRSDPVAALDYALQDLAINRDLGNRRAEAISLSCVGCGFMDLGEQDQASAHLQQSLQLLRANGDRVIEGATLCSLSTVALRQGDVAQAIDLAQAAVQMAAAVQSRDLKAIALCKLGHAALAAARLDDAASAYQRCLELALALDEPVRHDARAGLAQVALAAGRPGQAMLSVQALLDHLDAAGSLDGAEDPLQIELRCHRVLAANGDPRAAGWLQRASTHLRATAQKISDPALRRSFVEQIPAHREIVALTDALTDPLTDALTVAPPAPLS